jgi:hypothetical protein
VAWRPPEATQFAPARAGIRLAILALTLAGLARGRLPALRSSHSGREGHPATPPTFVGGTK